ncbi:MAG: hypothetical protein ACK5P5_01980 [Pseudobdellovibrionaceae bacterium]
MSCRVDFKAIDSFFVENIPVKNLTVGHIFYLSCKGEFGLNPNFERSQFSLSDEEKNLVKLLKVEQRSPTEIDLQVVSYTPGNHKIQDLKIEVDGELFALGPVDFFVESVIEMKYQKGDKVQPIGPLGPVRVDFPQWFFIGVFLAIAFIFSVAMIKIFRRYQRRKYLSRTEFQKQIPALLEFEKNLRVALRAEAKGDLVTAIQKANDAWRIYWTRTFQFPAAYLSERRLLGEFKKQQVRLHHLMSREIAQFVWDMRRIRKNPSLVSQSDFEAYLKRCRQTIEKVDREVEKNKGRVG